MAQLYGRKFSLIIADAAGKGLDLSQLRCTFEIAQWESATPNTAQIRIANVAKATADRIMREFTQIVLQAGYEGQFGVIFRGSIIQSRRGREGGSSVDTYVALTAADGDQALNFAVVNTTLAAGATPADIHKAACNAMNPHGVEQGYTAPLPGPALPRGKVLYGMARDVLSDNCRSTGTQWTVLDGRVQVIPQTGYTPAEAVELTSATGLIGLPQITMDGISVRCLLNPLLKVNGRIKLNNASLQDYALPANPNEAQVQRGFVPKKDSDGIYRILAINHQGDSRGQPWYSDLVCVAADPNAFLPLSQMQRLRGGAGASSAGPGPLPPQQPIPAPLPYSPGAVPRGGG